MGSGQLVVTPRRVFRRFLIARAVSWVGTAMTLVALPVLLYQRTGSATLAGLLAGLEAVPYLLFGLPAGALADRWDRRRTMICSNLLSGLVMASVPVAAWAGVLTTPQLFVVAGLVATLFVFYDAAGFGALPEIVSRAELPAATGQLVSVSTVINLLGPAVGGVAAAAIGTANVLALDALSFLATAALLWRLRWATGAAGPAAGATAGVRRLGREIAEGIRYLVGHPVIRTLTLLGIGNSIAGGAVTGLLVVAAVRQLGMSDQDPRIGSLYVATAAGSLVTSLLLARIQRRFRTGTITLAGLAVCWLALVGWSQTTGWLIGLAVLVIWQASSTLVILNGIVVRQAVTPLRLQSRVNTTARMVAWGGTPLGAMLGGLAAEGWSTSTALLLASGAVAVTLVLGLATTIRRVGRLSDLIADAASGDAEPVEAAPA